MGEFKAPAAQQNKTATPVQAPKEASSLGETEYVDSRASTFQFIQLQAAADDRGKGNRITQLQSKSTQFTSFSRVAKLQAKRDSQIASTNSPVVQREENKTGLPDSLKSGMEAISGLSLGDVKVHRNSDKPAQLQAHAYAQGTDIHLGPGQEKHLPHELGHVVQQKEGRVKPTVQLKDKVSINDDSGLEKEADVLGQKAQARAHSKSSQKQLKKPESDNKLIQGVFRSNSDVYQFEGGEGGSSWIPAAIALGTGLFLVYRSWGQKKEEISADEAQKRDYVSSEEVERDAKELGAEPALEGEPVAVAAEPAVDTEEVPESVIMPTLGKQAPSSKGNKRANLKIGDLPDYLAPVVPAKNEVSEISSTYQSPQVNISPNKSDATLVKARGERRTLDSTTVAQVEIGNMSYESNSEGVGAKVSSGNASFEYTGQNIRTKGNAEGPGAELHYGEKGYEGTISGGEVSAEVAGSVEGDRWMFTAGAQAEAKGPNIKYGPEGKEVNGPSTGVRAGISAARKRDPKDPASARQVFAVDRKKGELPTVYLNGEEIYLILQEKISEGVSLESGPEVEDAVDMYRSAELNIPLADLRKMQEDDSSKLPPKSFFETIASFFKSDRSSSSSSNKSSSDDDKSSSSSWVDDETKSESKSESSPVAEAASEEAAAPEASEQNETEEKSEKVEEIELVLKDYFSDFS